MKGKITRFSAVALVAALTLMPGQAAAQDVSGTWDVRWAQAVRINGDGSIEIQAWGEATLALSQEGAHVTGTWTTNVLEEVNWTVVGTLEGDRLALRATEHDSANPELDVVEQIVWQGTVTADRIEGTVALWFRGMDRDPGERPFTATHAS